MPRFSACCTNFFVISRSWFTYLQPQSERMCSKIIVDLDLQLEELHLARLSSINQLVECTRGEGWDLYMR